LFSLGISLWETARQKTDLAPGWTLHLQYQRHSVVGDIFGTLDGMNGILLWPTAVLYALIGTAMLRVILAASLEPSDA